MPITQSGLGSDEFNSIVSYDTYTQNKHYKYNDKMSEDILWMILQTIIIYQITL